MENWDFEEEIPELRHLDECLTVGEVQGCLRGVHFKTTNILHGYRAAGIYRYSFHCK